MACSLSGSLAFTTSIMQSPAKSAVITLPVTEQIDADAGSTAKLVAPVPEPPFAFKIVVAVPAAGIVVVVGFDVAVKAA